MPTLAFQRLLDCAQADRPVAAIVLGSGMGRVAERLRAVQAVPFVEVPGLQATSVQGHHGQVSLGDWAGRRVLLFEGRLHYYECQSWRTVAAPLQTAQFLGTRVLLLTNAAGGIHDALLPGRLMLVRDHIEWNRPYCWQGLMRGEVRPSPYSPRLRQLFYDAGLTLGLRLHEGVYAAVTGPCYETPAEIRALRAWGADAVGMSTAREVQLAHDAGLECAAVSLITNRAAGLSDGPIHHGEVLTNAAAQAERLADLLEGVLRRLG
ncbi:MAG: purine-nucleoside phosphorylase [Planctomycetia bacterium]|nr:purine-nucleoside phosphorylase [Planctomycetia bacterium]